jgi:hypothetical protein
MPESAAAEAGLTGSPGTQPSPETEPSTAGAVPAQEWHAPVVVQLKALVFEAIGILIAAVFFPVGVAIPVSVLLALWGISMCARRPQVLLDPDTADGKAGLLTIRLGLITRRILVSEIEAVVLDRAKVTIGKTGGAAISFYAWRKSQLDAWLKVPDVSSDVAHAISKAATAAQARTVTAHPASTVPADTAAPVPEKPKGKAGRTGRSGKNLPLIVMAVAGVLEIAAAAIVRVSWGNLAMTVLAIIVALALGFTGMFTLVFTLWTYLRGQRRGRAS